MSEQSTLPGMAPQTVATVSGSICPACGGDVPPQAIRRGESKTYCSPGCRSRAWEEDHPRARERSARDRGKALAAGKNDGQLETVRAVARDLAQDGRSLSIEDVREECDRRGLDITWGNWTGSVFRRWVPVGYVQARHKGSHARVVRVWRMGWYT